MSKVFDDNTTKIKNYLGLPDFLSYEIDKKGNKKLMKINIDLYLKIYERIINNFNIEKDLERINSLSLGKKGSIEMTDKKEKNKNEKYIFDIFHLEPNDISKILKEYTNNKEAKNKLKEKLNLLFLTYNEEFKDLPLLVFIFNL